MVRMNGNGIDLMVLKKVKLLAYITSPLASPLKIKQQKGPSGTGNTENVICNQEVIVKS